MLGQLRTPAAFCLLTVVVAGWGSAWTLPGEYYMPHMALNERNMHRPAYWLANRAVGRNTLYRMITGCGFAPSKETCFVETASGCAVATLVPVNGRYSDTHNGETILAAGKPRQTRVVDEYGLLAPVAYRVTKETNLIRVAHFPPIDPKLVSESSGGRTYTNLDAPYPVPTDYEWTFKPRAAVHDALFLLTTLSWFVSLAAIPKWPLWHHLPPAQRRRARNACPTCAYSLEGLTSTTCPECNTPLPLPPPQEGARAAGG